MHISYKTSLPSVYLKFFLIVLMRFIVYHMGQILLNTEFLVSKKVLILKKLEVHHEKYQVSIIQSNI